MAILRKQPSDNKLSERGTLFAFTNYDGGLPSHSKPEAKGRLLVTNERWELRFEGSKEFVHGGIARYPLGVTATSESSSHVVIQDLQERNVHAALDLPSTAASTIEEVLATTMNGQLGVPPPRSGNIYPLVNYDGGMPGVSLPAPKGSLVLTPDQFVELHFVGSSKKSRSPIARYPLSVIASGPSSCRVEITDLKDPMVRASFELPDTAAETLLEDLAGRPNGTWSQPAEDARRSQAAARFTVILKVTYLGGLPEDPRKHQMYQTLLFHGAQGIGYGTFSMKKPIMAWKQVNSIAVEGGQVAKNKVGAELVFGILGGLGAKGAKDRTYVIVNRKDGAQGIWEVDKMAPMQVRAKLGPVLQAAGVPFADAVPVTPAAPAASLAPTIPPAATSMAEELERLADLRDRGILTDQEFSAAKARLLEP